MTRVTPKTSATIDREWAQDASSSKASSHGKRKKDHKKRPETVPKGSSADFSSRITWSLYVVYIYGIMKSCNLCLSYKKENIYRPRLGEDPSNRTCNAGTYKIVDENHCLIKIAHL